MSLSLTATTSALSFETDEVWLVLLEFTHDSITEPLRFVNNNVDITSNGNVYTAYPFSITLPDETQDTQGECKLRIDNVDLRITEFIRSIQGIPTATISVILADTPDVIEASYDMNLSGVEYDSSTVEGTIIYDDVLNQAFPYRKFNPSMFPGMF